MPVVELLLPKFVPGVGALQALCFGAIGLGFGNFASVVLMTLGRQTMLMPTAFVSIAIGAALDLTAIKLGYGITGVAWATLATYAINGAILLSMALTGLGLSGRGMLGAIGRCSCRWRWPSDSPGDWSISSPGPMPRCGSACSACSGP